MSESDYLLNAPTVRRSHTATRTRSRSINSRKSHVSQASHLSTKRISLKGNVMSRLFKEDDKQKKKEPKEIVDERPHSFLFSMLNNRSHKIQAKVYKAFITTVISISVFSFILSTEPYFSKRAAKVFDIIEAVTSCIFMVELILRIYVIAESRRYRHPFFGRLKYLKSFGGFIDVVSTVPYFIQVIAGVELPVFTYLRVLRLFRLLKTAKYAKVINTVYRVLYFNSEILTVALLICFQLLLVTSALMYYLRPMNAPDFDSIPNTMYLSLLMLTGQGLVLTGDVADAELPYYTKIIVGLTGVFSVAMFAIPSSMLTWGFEAEAERLVKHAYAKNKKRKEQQRNYELGLIEQINDASSSSTGSSAGDFGDSQSDWDEYIDVIAGDGSEEEPETFGVPSLHKDILAVVPGPGTSELSQLKETIAQQNADIVDLKLQINEIHMLLLNKKD